MNNYRYSIAFLVSSILFTVIGFSIFIFAQRVEKPKELSKSVIKVSIITPIDKKIIKKKKPILPLSIPKHHKIKKKIKHKHIYKKKKLHKRKVIQKIKSPKKNTKKRVNHKKVIHKIKPNKIVKPIIKKRYTPTPNKIVNHKKVIHKIKPNKRVKPIIKKRYTPTPNKIVYYKKVIHKRKPPKRVKPIIEEIYTPPPQPTRVIEKVVKAPTTRKIQRQPKKVDKSIEKRGFLSQVRSKIIANKRYPRVALRQHIQGSVKVKFDITANGNVTNICYINGKSILQKGARKAIEKSFPIDIPSSLRSELPINDIYLTIHFNID